MNIKRLIQTAQSVEKSLYTKLSQYDEKDLLIRRLNFNFYKLGPNVASIQYAISADETYSYLHNALKTCVVIEYDLKLFAECNNADVVDVLQSIQKFKNDLIKETKSIKRVLKTDIRLKEEWQNILYNVVIEQLNKFDAYSLVSAGCNTVFAEEALQIVNQIIPNANVEYVTCIVANVMEKSYSICFDKNKFLPFAKKIYDAWNEIIRQMNERGTFTVYYKVQFQNSGYEYTYLYGGNDVCVGDHVLVPVNPNLTKTPARVSAIHTIFRKSDTMPVCQRELKSIIRKISNDEYEIYMFEENYCWD